MWGIWVGYIDTSPFSLVPHSSLIKDVRMRLPLCLTLQYISCSLIPSLHTTILDVLFLRVNNTTEKKSGIQLEFEPKTSLLVRHSYHRTHGRGVEDKLHKQHCLKASAEFQLILTLSGNATYVACLSLLCQGSEWLNGKSVWLVSSGVGFKFQLDPRFISVDLFLTLSTKTSFMSAYCHLHKQHQASEQYYVVE